MSPTVLEQPVVTLQSADFADAAALIEALRASAAKILGSALGAAPLVAFQIGANGNFPYYWQSNRLFNHLTYDWINSNLAANKTPLAQDELFTNLYIQALAVVNHSLSTADLATLTAAQQKARQQQDGLLAAWKDVYGDYPPTTTKQTLPIDVIMYTIATEWADPPTTLMAIKTSKNLAKLLSNRPASAEPVVDALARYLDAIGSAISLQNAATMNTGYLQEALDAVQSPSTDTGGVTTDDDTVHPAYRVSTPLADILNGLKAKSNAVTVKMSVARSSTTEYTVSVSGRSSFRLPIFSFLTVGVGGNASYFSDSIATTSNTVDVTMTFPGVTLVNFGPVPFDASIGMNWFWMEPIRDAIANGTQDVTGFKFAPKPQIDFSSSGPFGFLQGVAISNYPSIQIVVTSSQYQKIQQDCRQQASAGISFLGVSLGGGAGESTYSGSTTVDSASQTVTITLNPPPEMIAGTKATSVGWVLGVQPRYPAS